MGATYEGLDDEQFKSLEEEKKQLVQEQKLLNMDIRAMELELRRRSGAPAPGEPSALATLQELTQLTAELTSLQLDELAFQLVSAERGVTVTRWRVRVASQQADAQLCLEYSTTKDEESHVTCSDLEVIDFTPSLAPLVKAAGTSVRVALFGLYQLGRLTAERRQAVPDAVPDTDPTGAVRLPLPGGRRLRWDIEIRPGEERYRHVLTVEDKNGEQSPLPAPLQELLREHGVQGVVDRLQNLQK